ncbi:UDP-N-acetylglucosamine:LPS N-acetylglucosamine transferase [Streptacidiphilus sp. MAP5-52]
MQTAARHTRLSVVMRAGGTGGHIYPGLALAEALRRAEPRARITFVGTERGLGRQLISAAGFPLHTVDVIPFDRSLSLRRYLLPAHLLRSGLRVRQLLHRQGAQVVVGQGSYPGALVTLGVRLARLPALVHESNAVRGRANASLHGSLPTSVSPSTEPAATSRRPGHERKQWGCHWWERWPGWIARRCATRPAAGP